MKIPLFLAAAAFGCTASAATPAEWRSKIIYQVLTDRSVSGGSRQSAFLLTTLDLLAQTTVPQLAAMPPHDSMFWESSSTR